MPYKYGNRTREFLGAFLFPFQSTFPRFWLSIISYPTRARGIIVNYYYSQLGRAPCWLSIIQHTMYAREVIVK